MTNGKNGLGKTVGIIALGGLTDAVLEYVADKYVKQSVSVDKLDFTAADAVGTGTGIATIGAGMLTKKPNISLFGAGALAVAVAGLINRQMYNYNLSASARANSANTTYAGVHSPRPSPTAPPADPQQMLVAGSQGGGKVVYKPVVAGANADITQLII